MDGCPLACRPLRQRALIAQLLALAVGEGLLFAVYAREGAQTEWAADVLLATTLWALVNVACLTLKGAPARGHVVALLGWHLVAMVGDLLFDARRIGQGSWLNVLAEDHPEHGLVNSLGGLLATALVASGMYGLVLAGWISARRAEVAAGMAPGVGLGGSHLVRPQRPIGRVQLAHHHFGPLKPPDVVLLHGLAASYATWRPVAERLADRGISVVVPDLLGFGRSRHIGTTFGLVDHARAVLRLLDATGAEGTLIVGHSFGCAVAVEVARMDAGSVDALVLVAPPAFRDAESAKSRLAQRGWLARQVVGGTPAASAVCNAMCLTRSAAARVALRLAHDVPEDVARDFVEHTWPAYRDALGALLENNPVPSAIEQPLRPTTVILGDADAETPASDVLDWPHDHVRVEFWPSDHLLPLRKPERLAEVLAGKIERS